MYARLVIAQVKPDKMDDLIRIYRDSIVPAAKQQKGCKGAYLMTDPTTGKAFSEVIWETEADMKAGEASGYLNEQIAKVSATFVSPPITERYEISVQA
ncbi:MAG: antibiotic biosynthesis monooxygenase [Chloroflexi bacterium]|nr:antibiotic biosynthesis monooxygenase [Chloroflexota bacterium]